jgi:trans-aconitate 2-methyltransferase
MMNTNHNEQSNTWSAAQYTKFEKERNRPILDLLMHIPADRAVKNAIDIGCGPGNSTELLQARFPEANVSGIDSSPDMISAAKKRMPSHHFEVADISGWQDEKKYDMILSNAALQWVPNHDSLFPALIDKLTVGGTLAVQMPDNWNEPAQKLMRTVAANGPWANQLTDAPKRVAREEAGWYYQFLRDKVETLDIWRTTYFHPLSGGAEAIVEWFKGTGLRPYIDALHPDEQKEYLARLTGEIVKAYQIYDDGTVLLPFPRLFIICTR